MFNELYGDIGAEVPGHADFADDAASGADPSEMYDFAPDPKDDGSGGSRLSVEGSLSQTSSRRRRGRRGSGQQQPTRSGGQAIFLHRPVSQVTLRMTPFVFDITLELFVDG